MSKNVKIQLSNPVMTPVGEEIDSLMVDGILMYEEDVVDSNGKALTITKDLMRKLSDNYRSYLRSSIPEKLKRFLQQTMGKEPEPRYAPVILDHVSWGAKGRVGDITDLVVIDHLDTDTGETHSFLRGYFTIRGAENIQAVKDGRLKRMSISFTLDENGDPINLEEASFVLFEAIPGAAVYFSRHSGEVKKKAVTKKLRSLEEAIYKLARCELKRAFADNQRHFSRQLDPYLHDMAKKGVITFAAKKSLSIILGKQDKKVQDIVCECLRIAKSSSTISGNSDADVLGAQRMEKLLMSVSLGDFMSKNKKSGSPLEQFKEAMGAPDKSNAEVANASALSLQFKKLVDAAAEKKVKALRENFEQVKVLLSAGKYKEAYRFASDDKEDEAAEDFKDEDEDSKREELKALIRKIIEEVLADVGAEATEFSKDDTDGDNKSDDDSEDKESDKDKEEGKE